MKTLRLIVQESTGRLALAGTLTVHHMTSPSGENSLSKLSHRAGRYNSAIHKAVIEGLAVVKSPVLCPLA